MPALRSTELIARSRRPTVVKLVNRVYEILCRRSFDERKFRSTGHDPPTTITCTTNFSQMALLLCFLQLCLPGTRVLGRKAPIKLRS